MLTMKSLPLRNLKGYAGRTAALLVTHEEEAARYADRVLTMDGGRLTEG